MTHASLFSGIGGFDLAAEWMGWHNAFHCEINVLDGITFSKWRQESVKAYGNAIVPQVSYEIFKAIELCR